MPAKPTTIDEYLAAMDPEPRAALEKLRKVIRSAVPKAEEYIGYGLAAFRLDGKPIAGMGAGASHCAYYPMSGSVVETLKNDLTNYETSKGAVRFSVKKPLPASLVRKLIRARIAEIAADQRVKKHRGVLRLPCVPD